MFTPYRPIEKITDRKRDSGLFIPALLMLSGLLTSCTIIMMKGEGTDPAPLPTRITVTDQPGVAFRQVYQSDDGRFSLQYPNTAIFYVDQRVSVDGVVSPAENTIAIRDTSNGGSVLNLTYYSLPDNTSLADFIRNKNDCQDLSSLAGQSLPLQGHEGLLFPDTNCGPYGTTFIYTTTGDIGYRFTIETHENYSATAHFTDLILNSFQTQSEDITADATPLP